MSEQATIWVTAGNNGPLYVPESLGRVYDAATGLPIDKIASDPVEVPDDRFYRRRIAVGDLVRVEPPEIRPVSKPYHETSPSADAPAHGTRSHKPRHGEE